MAWKVTISRKAEKKAKKLPSRAMAAFRLLWLELKAKGPIQHAWPHFGKLKGKKDEWHCHLKQGRPTYVACWRVEEYPNEDREEGQIQIFYAWTHEDAPY